jgi:hypothetical protein
MKHLLLALGLALGTLAAVAGAEEKKPATYLKVEAKGKLKTGIFAIGGETTGTTLTTTSGVVELDVSGDKELMAQVKKLAGKTVVATGTLTVKRGVERGIRLIVKVKSLKAAD